MIAPLGLEASPYYLSDGEGVAFVLGGLNMRSRDYARFGLMYEQMGEYQGQQIVPRDWVAASTRASAPTKPDEIGYGYQWWIPGNPMTDFTAHGVYNQFIYVDPVSGVVIAKTSSNHRFRSEKDYSKAVHIAMFRSIAKHISKQAN